MILITYIILIICCVLLFIFAHTTKEPVLYILATIFFLGLAIVSFSQNIVTNQVVDKNIIVVDSNTTLEQYSYTTLNYSNDNLILILAYVFSILTLFELASVLLSLFGD